MIENFLCFREHQRRPSSTLNPWSHKTSLEPWIMQCCVARRRLSICLSRLIPQTWKKITWTSGSKWWCDCCAVASLMNSHSLKAAHLKPASHKTRETKYGTRFELAICAHFWLKKAFNTSSTSSQHRDFHKVLADTKSAQTKSSLKKEVKTWKRIKTQIQEKFQILFLTSAKPQKPFHGWDKTKPPSWKLKFPIKFVVVCFEKVPMNSLLTIAHERWKL